MGEEVGLERGCGGTANLSGGGGGLRRRRRRRNEESRGYHVIGARRGGGLGGGRGGGGGGGGGWSSSPIFLEQPLERELTPFFRQMTARVCGGVTSPLIEPIMGQEGKGPT